MFEHLATRLCEFQKASRWYSKRVSLAQETNICNTCQNEIDYKRVQNARLKSYYENFSKRKIIFSMENFKNFKMFFFFFFFFFLKIFKI